MPDLSLGLSIMETNLRFMLGCRHEFPRGGHGVQDARTDAYERIRNHIAAIRKIREVHTGVDGPPINLACLSEASGGLRWAVQTMVECFSGADGGAGFNAFCSLCRKLDALAGQGEREADAIMTRLSYVARLVEAAKVGEKD